MRNIVQTAFVVLVALALNGCVSITKTDRRMPFEVAAVDIGTIESSVYAVRDTGVTTTRIATKQITVAIDRLAAEPFSEVVFTLKREDTGNRYGSPAANLDVVHGQRDRYQVTFLVDERDVPSKDIVVEVAAGGVTTHVVFNRRQDSPQPLYVCYKQTGGSRAQYEYGAWSRVSGRFLMEETPLDTVLTAHAH